MKAEYKHYLNNVILYLYEAEFIIYIYKYKFYKYKIKYLLLIISKDSLYMNPEKVNTIFN